jgi:hypothetical protein
MKDAARTNDVIRRAASGESHCTAFMRAGSDKISKSAAEAHVLRLQSDLRERPRRPAALLKTGGSSEKATRPNFVLAKRQV